MPKMHLKQPGFTYSACGPFTKNKERIQNVKETGDSRYIYKNELDKACFQHGMVYENFKDLARRAALDKVLHNKALNTAKNPKYDGHQRGLASTVHSVFDKKSAWLSDKSGKGSGFKSTIKQNEQLAEELYKPVIRKFKKRKVHSSFKDNTQSADLTDMQLINKCTKRVRFLLRIQHIMKENLLLLKDWLEL